MAEPALLLDSRAAATPPPRTAPRLSGGWPFLGRMGDFRRDPIALLLEAVRDHGDVCSVPLLGNQLVLLASPDGHEAFFRGADEQVSQKEAYKFTVPVFGKGIAYDATPEVMSEQVGFLLPALRDAAMRTYAPKLASEVADYVARWGAEGEVDAVEVMKELTTYTSSRCLLGEEFRESMGAEFAELYAICEKGLNQIAFFWPNAPLPSFRRRDRARVELVKLIGKVVNARRAKGVRGDDMLQALIDARYKDGRGLTDDEITGILLVVIFAGHHTSSVTSAWTGIELHRNEGQLAPVLDELDRVLAPGAPPSYQTMRQCERLEWAVRETLRLHPPLIMLMRKVLKDFTFRDFRVPAGQMLLVSPAAAHRLPTFFHDPDRFDPERYTPAREKEIHPYAWVPFGAGKHKCLGHPFAMLQIKTVWATLLREFEFELVEDRYEPDYDAMVVGPKQPCRIRYRRRTRAPGTVDLGAHARGRR